MAFETLDIKIKAEAGDAESALDEVRDSLIESDAAVEQFSSSLNEAEEETEELEDETGSLNRSLTTLIGVSNRGKEGIQNFGNAAGGAAVSVATLGGSITALEAALAPLVAGGAVALGAVAGGLAAVAGAAGLVVGSGLLAFGQELAGNNQRRLNQLNKRIETLQALEQTESGLTAKQSEQLETLKNRRKEVEETTTAAGALTERLSEIRSAFVDAFSDAGEQFVPLIRDALNALPPLIRDIGDAFENADLSNVTGLLRDIGGAINQNAVGAFETFLELANDTAGGLRRIANNEAVSSFVSDLASAAQDLGRALGEIAVDVIEFLESDEADQIFQAINKQVNRLLPDLVILSENVASIFNTLEENPEATTGAINAVGASLNTVVDALNILLPTLEPVIEAIADANDAFNDLDSNVQGVITLFTGPFGLINVAVANALAGIIPSVSDVSRAFDDLKRDVRRAFQDIRSFLSNRAPNIIRTAVSGLFASLITAAKDLKRDLIGNSILRDIFTEFEAFLRNEASTLIGDAIDQVVSVIETPFKNIGFGGVISELNDIIDAAEDALDAVTNIPDIPEVTNPFTGEEPDGPDDGRTTDPDDPAGPTDPNPNPRDDNPNVGGGLDDNEELSPGDTPGPGIGLATGGLIASGGLARLHEGERVIPAAQVEDRGPAPSGISIQNLTVNASSRAEGRQAAKGLKDELKRFDI